MSLESCRFLVMLSNQLRRKLGEPLALSRLTSPLLPKPKAASHRCWSPPFNFSTQSPAFFQLGWGVAGAFPSAQQK